MAKQSVLLGKVAGHAYLAVVVDSCQIGRARHMPFTNLRLQTFQWTLDDRDTRKKYYFAAPAFFTVFSTPTPQILETRSAPYARPKILRNSDAIGSFERAISLRSVYWRKESLLQGCLPAQVPSVSAPPEKKS